MSRRPALLSCCRGVNRLGDGWLYLGAGVLALWIDGPASWRMLMASAVSAGLAFLPYLWLKPTLKRLRPYDLVPALDVGAPVLDRYSCPSGHCMTLTAAGIPIVWVHPGLIPVLLGVGLALAWARVALGHHYPSDLLAGVALGATCGFVVTSVLL